MIGNTDLVKQAVIAFKDTSSFRGGDYLGFSIQIAPGISLPGKYSAEEYLKKIDAKGSVAVVFPGNGGLVSDLIKRGFDVVAVEPRNQYDKTLEFLSETCQLAYGKKFEILAQIYEMSKNYDTIIWPEAFETLTDPIETLSSVIGKLSPDGVLFLEIQHGDNDLPQKKINSWRPKEDIFEKHLKSIPDIKFTIMDGRLDRRSIYRISKVKLKKKKGN